MWTEDADAYYQGIMEGNVSVAGAQAAEAYLRTQTHPIIANRMVAIAKKVGFDLNDMGNVVGVEGVDIGLLKAGSPGLQDGTAFGQEAC